jgi:tetratricopeptide (TPR) repeat protein
METQANTIQQAFANAEQLREQGELARAEQLYRQIISQQPGHHPAYHGLALLANTVGNLKLAIEMVKNAIAINNQVALYSSNLCEMCRRAGMLDEAINAGNHAITLKPDNSDFKYNLALAYADNEDFDAAIKIYKALLSIKSDHGLACNNLGAALEKSGKVDDALEYYAKAVEINPDHAEAQNNMGAIYSERGQLEEAKFCFSAAIKAKGNFIEPYYNLSSLKTFTLSDPDLKGLKKLMKDVTSLPVEAQVRYYFALGKAFEDVAEYNDAFNACQRANQLKFSQINYKERQASAVVQRIRKEFARDAIEKLKPTGIDDGTPIFILGMPRSGTSLIEQILASHKDIHGAGELKSLDEVIHKYRGEKNRNQSTLPSQKQLQDYDYSFMASEYLQTIRELGPDKKYITDKMPANFFYIGFIHLMFPNAKIIHSMRDPMDSCFSCYAKLFNETMDFTYNLQTLGNYYVRYIKLMQHWHEVLPPGTILDVKYENVVADVEAQARRMLEYINVPWDKNCLEFYKNKRAVKTASVAQVRKPIYASSVARWEHFKEQLMPLLDIVKEYRT